MKGLKEMFVYVFFFFTSYFAYGSPFLLNGDFEQEGPNISGWTTSVTDATVDLYGFGSQWIQCQVGFNTNSYNSALIVIGSYSWPSGKCYIDNIQSAGFTVSEPSFESSLTGWQCDPGVSICATPKSDGSYSAQFYSANEEYQMVRVMQTINGLTQNTNYNFTFDLYLENDYDGVVVVNVLGLNDNYPPKEGFGMTSNNILGTKTLSID